MIAKVLLPLPFNEPFDYKVDTAIELGSLVRVPFGREVLVGVVWSIANTSNLDDKKLVQVKRRLFTHCFLFSFERLNLSDLFFEN